MAVAPPTPRPFHLKCFEATPSPSGSSLETLFPRPLVSLVPPPESLSVPAFSGHAHSCLKPPPLPPPRPLGRRGSRNALARLPCCQEASERGEEVTETERKRSVTCPGGRARARPPQPPDARPQVASPRWGRGLVAQTNKQTNKKTRMPRALPASGQSRRGTGRTRAGLGQSQGGCEKKGVGKASVPALLLPPPSTSSELLIGGFERARDSVERANAALWSLLRLPWQWRA